MKQFYLGVACAAFLILFLACVPLMAITVVIGEARAMWASWRDESHVGEESPEDAVRDFVREHAPAHAMKLDDLGLHRCDVRA